MNKLVELYKYRGLLANLVVNELKLRYRRSFFGFLWTLLNPMLTMAVLTVVFSTIMRFDMKHYSVLIFSGLLPWIFFSQSINGSLMSIVGKGSLLKKVYIPKAVIPLSSVLATLVNFILSFIPLVIIMAIAGKPLTWAALFLPVSVLLLALFACGFAFLFSSLNVFFRDFTHMTEVLLQVLFYLSPVIYTVKLVPEQYQHMFTWNPLLYLIDMFRTPLYDDRLPDTFNIMVAAGAAFTALFVGFFVFLRSEKHFVLRV